MFKVVSPSRGLGILQLGALIGGFALISSILRWEEGKAARLIIYLSILILGVLLGSAWRGEKERAIDPVAWEATQPKSRT